MKMSYSKPGIRLAMLILHCDKVSKVQDISQRIQNGFSTFDIQLSPNNMRKKSGVSERRRNLLKGLIALPFAGSFSIISPAARNSLKEQDYLTQEAKASLKKVTGVLPKGKLGKYEISRLVLGCNPMGGWAHSRDLSYVGQLSKLWHTETKMKETWAIAEQAGINLCNVGEFQYKAINEFKKETGSKMLYNCQCMTGSSGDRLAPVKKV